jgi:hypothetical protein
VRGLLEPLIDETLLKPYALSFVDSKIGDSSLFDPLIDGRGFALEVRGELRDIPEGFQFRSLR